MVRGNAIWDELASAMCAREQLAAICRVRMTESEGTQYEIESKARPGDRSCGPLPTHVYSMLYEGN